MASFGNSQEAKFLASSKARTAKNAASSMARVEDKLVNSSHSESTPKFLEDFNRDHAKALAILDGVDQEKVAVTARERNEVLSSLSQCHGFALDLRER